jgi:hypothetical protein
MAYVYVTGFEGGNSDSDAIPFNANLPVWDTSVVRTGNYSIKVSVAGTTRHLYQAVPGAVEQYARVYVNISNISVAGHFFLMTTANAIRAALRINTDRTISLIDVNSSVIGVGSTVLNFDNWHRVEFRAKVDTATTGSAEVRIDGTTEFTNTTANFGVQNLDRVYVGSPGGILGTYSIYFDDFAINNSQFPGEGRVVRLIPAGDDTAQFDNPVTSVLHWQNAAAIPFQDTNYNYHASTAAATDLYDLTTASTAGITSNDTINTVFSIWRLKRDTGGTSTHQSAYKINGTQINTTRVLGTGFDNYTEIYDTVPSVGGAWTTTLLDTFKLGARHDSGAQDTYISKAGANVDYTVGEPPPPATSVLSGVRLLTLLGVG